MITRDPNALLDLPAEMLVKIIGFLTLQDILNLRRACRELRVHASSNVVWKPIVNSHLQGEPHPDIADGSYFALWKNEIIALRSKKPDIARLIIIGHLPMNAWKEIVRIDTTIKARPGTDMDKYTRPTDIAQVSWNFWYFYVEQKNNIVIQDQALLSSENIYNILASIYNALPVLSSLRSQEFITITQTLHEPKFLVAIQTGLLNVEELLKLKFNWLMVAAIFFSPVGNKNILDFLFEKLITWQEIAEECANVTPYNFFALSACVEKILSDSEKDRRKKGLSISRLIYRVNRVRQTLLSKK